MTGLPDAPQGDARPPGPTDGSSTGGSPSDGPTGAGKDGSAAGGPAAGGFPARGLDPESGRTFDREPGRGFARDSARGGDLSRDFVDGGPDGEDPDPLERLLRPPGEYLSPPPGSFERIRRKAARRRRNRVVAGGVVVAAMITGSVYLAGALSPHDSGDVVGPPATSSQVTHAPTPPGPTVRTPAPRPGTPSSTTSDGRPSPVTTGSSPTAVPSGTSGGRGVPPTPVAGTPVCTAAQLTAELGGGDAGAGNLYQYLVLTNGSDRACHVTGYPGLSLLDASGNEIGAPATRDRRPYQPVTLAPGASASDAIHTVNQQGTCLPTSTSLRIYPPGSRVSLVVKGRVTNCDNLLTVTPFTAGRTGNPSG